MYQDDYGLPVTAVNSDAAGHLSKAISSFVNWNLDFMDHVNRAMEVESELPMAHLLKGLVLAGGRHVQYRPVIENSICSVVGSKVQSAASSEPKRAVSSSTASRKLASTTGAQSALRLLPAQRNVLYLPRMRRPRAFRRAFRTVP